MMVGDIGPDVLAATNLLVRVEPVHQRTGRGLARICACDVFLSFAVWATVVALVVVDTGH